MRFFLLLHRQHVEDTMRLVDGIITDLELPFCSGGLCYYCSEDLH